MTNTVNANTANAVEFTLAHQESSNNGQLTGDLNGHNVTSEFPPARKPQKRKLERSNSESSISSADSSDSDTESNLSLPAKNTKNKTHAYVNQWFGSCGSEMQLSEREQDAIDDAYSELRRLCKIADGDSFTISLTGQYIKCGQNAMAVHVDFAEIAKVAKSVTYGEHSARKLKQIKIIEEIVSRKLPRPLPTFLMHEKGVAGGVHYPVYTVGEKAKPIVELGGGIVANINYPFEVEEFNDRQEVKDFLQKRLTQNQSLTQQDRDALKKAMDKYVENAAMVQRIPTRSERKRRMIELMKPVSEELCASLQAIKDDDEKEKKTEEFEAIMNDWGDLVKAYVDELDERARTAVNDATDMLNVVIDELQTQTPGNHSDEKADEAMKHQASALSKDKDRMAVLKTAAACYPGEASLDKVRETAEELYQAIVRLNPNDNDQKALAFDVAGLLFSGLEDGVEGRAGYVEFANAHRQELKNETIEDLVFWLACNSAKADQGEIQRRIEQRAAAHAS